MIIKGSARGQTARDARRLAAHLLNAENETVSLAEVRGAIADDLVESFAEWRAIAAASRTRKCLYHASINVDRDEQHVMTPDHWREAVDELERQLGLAGRPRCVVEHVKQGRAHRHVVWLRVDPATLRANRDSHTYRIHEAVARTLEERFGLRPVIGAHTRSQRMARPVAFASHAETQAADRTKVPIAEVAASIRGAWAESHDGPSFAAALEARGLILARGRRGVLILDRAGTPHSIPRRLGLKAGQVQERFRGLDEAALPTVEDVKRRNRRGKGMKERKQTTWGAAALGPKQDTDWGALEAWWRKQGFDPVKQWNCLWIDALGGTWRDYGDRLELLTDGEATPEQIEAMVRAAKDRGWDQTGVRFGGPEAFQRAAKAEAIRQGFDPRRIHLDCDKNLEQTIPEPMPEHLRRRLGLPEDDQAHSDTPQDVVDERHRLTV